MLRTPGEHAIWFVCTGVVVGVLGSMLKLTIPHFRRFGGVGVLLPLKLKPLQGTYKGTVEVHVPHVERYEYTYIRRMNAEKVC